MEVNNYNNVTYITSQNNKFKTSRISLKFALPITKDIIANALVLNDLLVMSTKNYSSLRVFNEKLYDLYDLSISTSISQKGRLHISDISFSFINSEYLSENIDDQVIDFISEVIYSPNFENEEYLKSVIDKRILEVKSIYDDKMMYCLKSMQKVLDPKGNHIIEVNSTVEDLENVTKESLIKFYQKLLKEANIAILIDGDNSKILEEKCRHKIQFDNASTKYEYLNKFELTTDYKFASEVQSLNQAKFAIGVKLDIDKDDFNKFQIFNAIYGGFPFSRLFSNIREKQSLAYSIGSMYIPATNIMYIYGGISNGDLKLSDEEHMSTVLTALHHELDSMINGDVTDLEISQAKSMIINSVKSGLDTQSANQGLYYANYLMEKEFNFDVFTDQINSVKKEDVVEMAKKVNFDTVFLLRGDK